MFQGISLALGNDSTAQSQWNNPDSQGQIYYVNSQQLQLSPNQNQSLQICVHNPCKYVTDFNKMLEQKD